MLATLAACNKGDLDLCCPALPLEVVDLNTCCPLSESETEQHVAFSSEAETSTKVVALVRYYADLSVNAVEEPFSLSSVFKYIYICLFF
jgi:hypothetical protein